MLIIFLLLGSYILFFIHTDEEPLEGYVHSVSPMKTAKSSKIKYFNYSLEKHDETLKGVCFSPQKCTKLKTLEETKSPVKPRHYKSSTDNDIVIDQKSLFSPCDQIPFAMSNITTADDVTNIPSLMNVTAEHVITLKAQVTHIAPVKNIISQRHGELQKQEIMLRDPSGTIKLVLWQQYVNTLIVNTTYVLQNMKLKVYNDERYLNTPKNEEFKPTQVEAFEQPLPEPERVIDTPVM